MVTSSSTRERRDQNDSPSLINAELVAVAQHRVSLGLPPPADLYLVQNRHRIPWSEFPGWARPSDPELFDGCCHEG